LNFKKHLWDSNGGALFRLLNNANIELKNANSNGDNVAVRNLNNMGFVFFLKIMKFEFKSAHCMLFFVQDVAIARKKEFLILFTSQFNIE
jgi:hypothetical protein